MEKTSWQRHGESSGIQANDDGVNNLFQYNHWNDWWHYPDSDDDGFIDNPYPIDGSSNNYDHYPWADGSTEPSTDSESDSDRPSQTTTDEDNNDETYSPSDSAPPSLTSFPFFTLIFAVIFFSFLKRFQKKN